MKNIKQLDINTQDNILPCDGKDQLLNDLINNNNTQLELTLQLQKIINTNKKALGKT